MAGGKRKRERCAKPSPIPTQNFVHALAMQQCGLNFRRADDGFREQMFRHVPCGIIETQFKLPSINKLFAMEWIDSHHVLVGSKCNQLFLLDISRPALQYRKIPLPPAPPRSFLGLTHGWGQCGIHCIAKNPCGDLIATGGQDPNDAVVLRSSDYSPVTTLIGHRDWLFGTAWVTDRHLVTGSRDQSTALWTIDHDLVVDKSATATVQEYDYWNPGHMKRKYTGKVREVKYDADLGLVAALSTDGGVALQDPGVDLRAVRRLKVSTVQDLVAMALRRDIVVSAGLAVVSMSDPRRRDPLAFIGDLQSPDGMQGVRSVCIKDHVVSLGTGRGKIAFWDLRAQKFLPTSVGSGRSSEPLYDSSSTVALAAQQQHVYPWMPPSPGGQFRPAGGTAAPVFEAAAQDRVGFSGPIRSSIPQMGQYLELGKGWICTDEDSMYYMHRFGHPEGQACYAHGWDASGTRLFAVGGPLAFGLSGGYLGLWH